MNSKRKKERPHLSHPDSRSDPIGRSEPSSGCETIYWDFFFFQTELVPVGMAHILKQNPKNHIHIKRTTTGVVSIKLYIHILSLIHLYKNYIFTFTNQSTKHTVMNPY